MIKISPNLLLVLFFLILLLLSNKIFANENIFNKQSDKNISLNFNNIKIRSALQYLSELNNKNLIIDDKLQGVVSIYLHDIDWDQALDTILQTQGLAKRAILNGWFITTPEHLLKQDTIKLAIQQKKRDLFPLIFKVLQIRYRKASDISKLLKDKANSPLSTRGSVSVDNLTNSLWIRDSVQQINQISASIRELDKPIGQILIEARIVSIDQNMEKELGAQFGSTQTANKLLKSQIRTKAKNSNTDLLQHLSMDLPITGNASSDVASMGLRLMRLKARGIKTQVTVKNNETVVLGGIYEYSQSKLEQRVPWLGTLPIIGRLFRLTTSNSRRSELLIFLTPTILNY